MTPDGKHIVFGGYGALNVADAGGTQLATVVSVNRPETPHQAPTYGSYADVSPDGSRIVYSTCQYETESLREALYDYYDRAEKYNYEIATIGIDGSSPKRLTENEHFDHYPVWSPDGARIAYVAWGDRSNPELRGRAQLRTMAADGSDVSVLTALPTGLTLDPPAWSPDGRWLAFLAYEEGLNPSLGKALYTVRADGSELSKVGETTELPAWSPDGRRLAFTEGRGSEGVVYTVEPDGGGLAELLRGMGGPVAWPPRRLGGPGVTCGLPGVIGTPAGGFSSARRHIRGACGRRRCATASALSVLHPERLVAGRVESRLLLPRWPGRHDGSGRDRPPGRGCLVQQPLSGGLEPGPARQVCGC